MNTSCRGRIGFRRLVIPKQKQVLEQLNAGLAEYALAENDQRMSGYLAAMRPQRKLECFVYLYLAEKAEQVARANTASGHAAC